MIGSNRPGTVGQQAEDPLSTWDPVVCPPADWLTLAVVSRKRAPGAETLKPVPVELVDHLSVCSDCAEIVQTLRGFESLVPAGTVHIGDASGSSEVAGRSPAARLRWPQLLAAAAMILVVSGASLMLFEGRSLPSSPGGEVRGATTVEVGAVLTATLPTSGSTLAIPPARFEWQAPAGPGTTYGRVEVLSQDSTLLWTSPDVELNAGLFTADIPLEIRSLLVPGLYLWQVQTLGLETTMSPLFEFTVLEDVLEDDRR